MQLTNAEVQVMRFLWKLEKAYMKNILGEFPEPRPATTTVATVLRRMVDKGFAGYNQHGSNREYFPLVQKTEYFSKHFRVLIEDYFNNSVFQLASFFISETKLSKKELKELKRMVNRELEIKKARKGMNSGRS